jgi:chorismate dehydratase
MPRLRISAISFLNTAPLMWDFEHGEAARGFEIDYTIPSLCAQALAEGRADIGLIPAVTYLTIPKLVIIPDIAIAARGPVRSILLVSKVPVEEIRTVAADNASRTSVALCRLLLKKWMRPAGAPEPEFTPMEADLAPMLAQADAALLIGDSALRVSHTEHAVFDLAEEWLRFTGQPFVFAFWAVREEAAQRNLTEIFQKSREHGLGPENLKVICREWAPRIGISEAEVYSYLTQNLCYSLDPANIAGLQLFWRLAHEENILPPPKPLRLLANAGETCQPANVAISRS